MNSLEPSQPLPGAPLFSLEYSEIGCQVAEDFWRYFMTNGSDSLNDSTSSDVNSDCESAPSSPSSQAFLSFPEEYQHLDHSIKAECADERLSSGEEFHEPQDFLFLSREDLLKLSSKELEDYAQALAASRPLTVEEEKLLKRQRRLIKNRESAQLSRQRKKIYIEDLERQVSALTAENIQLSKKVSTLSVNNHSLVEEVLHLQKAVKKGQPETNKTIETQKKRQTTEHNLRKAGLCLMIVLFSFGLFANNPAGSSGSLSMNNPFAPSLPNPLLPAPASPKHSGEQKNELSSIAKGSPKREREEDEEDEDSKRRRVESGQESGSGDEDSVLALFSLQKLATENAKTSLGSRATNPDSPEFSFLDGATNLGRIQNLEVD